MILNNCNHLIVRGGARPVTLRPKLLPADQ